MTLDALHLELIPSPKDFPGEALESLNIELAEEAVRNGEPYPPRTFTKDDSHVFSLTVKPEVQETHKATDTLLTLLIAYGLKKKTSFTLALKQDGYAGGPYLNVVKKSDYIEATLISNYRQLEPKEEWFSAVLSLFEWTNIVTGVLTTKLYRKVWPSEFPDIEVAASISEVMTYVLGANRSPYWVFVTFDKKDALLNALPENIYWFIPMFDASFAGRVTGETRRKKMIPSATTRSVHSERELGLEAVVPAIFIAEQVDDEIGITTLGQLKKDLEYRASYLDELRTSVTRVLDQYS